MGVSQTLAIADKSIAELKDGAAFAPRVSEIQAVFERLAENVVLDPEEMAMLRRVFDQLCTEFPACICEAEDLAAMVIGKYQAGVREETGLLRETRWSVGSARTTW